MPPELHCLLLESPVAMFEYSQNKLCFLHSILPRTELLIAPIPSSRQKLHLFTHKSAKKKKKVETMNEVKTKI